MYHTFIGIDISKDEFHVAIYGNNTVVILENNKSGFTKLCKLFKQELKNSLVVLETTGGYEMALVEYLQLKGIAVHRANTRKVKSFIRSLGKLGKSDSIDANGLARYAKERCEELDLYQQMSEIEEELLQLTNRRQELKQIVVQEKNRLQAPRNKFKSSNEAIIKSVQSLIEQVEQRQLALVNSNKELQNKVKLLVDEIDGVGNTTAIALISLFPELGGELNRRQIASLAGVAPHPYESGKKIGYRFTKGGRENTKPVLFMAAMTASRSKGKFGIFYKNLIANGKKPMVALVALMRKIIVIANAKLRDLAIAQKNLETSCQAF